MLKFSFVIFVFAFSGCSSTTSDQKEETSRGLTRTPESIERCQRDCENYPRNSRRVIETCKAYCAGGRSINGGSY